VITARVYEGGTVADLEADRVSEAMRRSDVLVWVDVLTPSDADLDCVQEQFGLHALAMEDVRERHQRAKLENYPSHTFIVAYSSGIHEVDLFVGPTWVVTVREDEGDGPPWDIGTAAARFERTRPEHVSPGYLLYVLLDELVDGYFDATDAAEDSLEKLEERIFSEKVSDERTVQQELFVVRRRLLEFRRRVVPLREVVGALMRREVPWIDENTATMLQDVYDHVLRAVDLLDGQRELLGNAVDAHLAIISNRMNGVMKKMTSWGAIILGSTLVAGIYGMNFRHMPELEWRFGFAYAISVMVIITVGGYWYFKGKDWL